MKKTVVMIGIVFGLLTASYAQSGSEYGEMEEWLFQYMLNGVTPQSDMQKYDEIKREWSQFGDEMYQNIKNSLGPIDPAITAAIEKLIKDLEAEIEQKAIALGYESFNDLYMKTKKGTEIPNDEVRAFYEWSSQRDDEVSKERQALTKAYDDELTSRFHAAFVDAVKKLQQNSGAMQ